MLRRKMLRETITPLRYGIQSKYDSVRGKLARMEEDYLAQVAKAQPDVTGLSNRAADNWAPLFAIADLAGGEWSKRARDAQRVLQQGRDPIVSTGVELLVAIKRIFQNKKLERISSAALVDALCNDPEAD